MPELLTTPEAAEYLRLTPSALLVQRHRGQQPGSLGFKVGRRILFRRSDIERYIDERAAAEQAQPTPAA